MNKKNLKKYITKILLEKVETEPSVLGKLVKKTIGFSGIQRECVCEGTIKQANEYAIENNLTLSIEKDSHFGGHYICEMTSYEFHPNAEFYGDLMETNMTAREQLSRICGNNAQILTEVDVQDVENLVDFIFTNESFYEERTDMVFERIQSEINNKLYDKTQFTKLFEYLVKQACLNSSAKKSLSESEMEYATKLLSRRFFEKNIRLPISVEETKTKCGKKSFKTGSAFENMQRIATGHQMFL